MDTDITFPRYGCVSLKQSGASKELRAVHDDVEIIDSSVLLYSTYFTAPSLYLFSNLNLFTQS